MILLARQVDLLHKPSGIRVKCQETRSLQDNRRIARKLIIKKVRNRRWNLSWLTHGTAGHSQQPRAFQGGDARRKSKGEEEKEGEESKKKGAGERPRQR